MMNQEKFLQKLFEGYVRSFSSFRWHTSANYADITAKELCHFSELGERLGFIVRREMNWHYPRDLCWAETSCSKSIPFLYMERENKCSRMQRTIEKILEPGNSQGIPFLVASFGHLTASAFSQASTMLRDGLQQGQSALLFAWIGEHENKGAFEVKANIFTESGVFEVAAIPYIDQHESYWCIRFEEGNANWFKLQ